MAEHSLAKARRANLGARRPRGEPYEGSRIAQALPTLVSAGKAADGVGYAAFRLSAEDFPLLRSATIS